MKRTKKEKTYLDSVHLWGRLWSIGALIALLMVPTAICAHFHAWPKFTEIMGPIGKVMLLNWTVAVVEVIAYTPLLGAGGTYLSFVTGNIVNLKLPCGLNAMAKADVKANTEEGEVVSTLAIGASAITTTLVIATGVLLLGPAVSVLKNNPVAKPAFAYVLPALFGALGAGYFRKNVAVSLLTIAVGCIVLLFAPSLGVGTLIFVTIITAIAGALGMFKLGWIK
ncbi:MAG: hypothetical protein IJK89_09175 [Clostridia bacterium]|nr:hypothetical protein [Clostridia bacterium]